MAMTVEERTASALEGIEIQLERLADALGGAVKQQAAALKEAGDLRSRLGMPPAPKDVLSEMLGGDSDGSELLPRQEPELPASGKPACSVHAGEMRGPRKSKKGDTYWYCSEKGDAHAGEPVNEKGYCAVLAFLNEDNTVRVLGARPEGGGRVNEEAMNDVAEGLFLANIEAQVNADMGTLGEALRRCEAIIEKGDDYEPTAEESEDMARMLEVRQALFFYRLARSTASKGLAPQLIIPGRE